MGIEFVNHMGGEDSRLGEPVSTEIVDQIKKSRIHHLSSKVPDFFAVRLMPKEGPALGMEFKIHGGGQKMAGKVTNIHSKC